jgi:hypothetical protein
MHLLAQWKTGIDIANKGLNELHDALNPVRVGRSMMSRFQSSRNRPPHSS